MLGTGALLLVLILLLCVPVALQVAAKRKVDLLSPPIAFAVLVFLGYVVPLHSIRSGYDVFSAEMRTPVGELEDLLPLAIGTLILAVAGFFSGFYRASAWSRARLSNVTAPARKFNPKYLGRVGGAFTAMALVMLSIGIHNIGGLSALLQGMGNHRLALFEGLYYFIVAPNMILAVVLVWWTYLLVKRTPWTGRFWLFTAATFCICALQGTKSLFVIVIIAGTVLYHRLYRRLRASTLISGAFLLIVLIASWNVVMREYLYVGRFVTLDLDNLAGSGADVVERQLTTNNFIQMQVLLTVVYYWPDASPYLYGSTYAAAVTAPVPRALWPEKPMTSPGVFTAAVWPRLWFVDKTSIPPGLIGEMYMNFGVWGAFPLSFLLGAGYGFADATARLRPSFSRLLFLALLIGTMPHYIRGELSSPSVLLLTIFLPGLAAVWVCSETARPQHTRIERRSATVNAQLQTTPSGVRD
jgi:oligosaccharide repeat unit polymerase